MQQIIRIERLIITPSIKDIAYQHDLAIEFIRDNSAMLERHDAQSWLEIISSPAGIGRVPDRLAAKADTPNKPARNERRSAEREYEIENVFQTLKSAAENEP